MSYWEPFSQDCSLSRWWTVTLLVLSFIKRLSPCRICSWSAYWSVLSLPQESAIFVCIVMELYKLGDLEKVLKGRRQTATPLDQLLLKKWIGQLLEAMHYVHSRKMIHRSTHTHTHTHTLTHTHKDLLICIFYTLALFVWAINMIRVLSCVQRFKTQQYIPQRWYVHHYWRFWCCHGDGKHKDRYQDNCRCVDI